MVSNSRLDHDPHLPSKVGEHPSGPRDDCLNEGLKPPKGEDELQKRTGQPLKSGPATASSTKPSRIVLAVTRGYTIVMRSLDDCKEL